MLEISASREFRFMRFSWKKTISWLPLLKKIQGRNLTLESITNSFLETYDDLEVFHAARPLDVKTYYEYGLRLADRSELNTAARNIFVSREFPEITGTVFQNAVNQLSSIEHAYAFVSLDDRQYTEDCGHYLIYGSEHICAIAANLTRHSNRDYRQILKRFGHPTIFRLSLPANQICKSNLEELAVELLNFRRIIKLGKTPPELDFTFSLKSPLAPESVLGHRHPKKIKDPLLPMQPVYYCS